jgi:hypothetical protein
VSGQQRLELFWRTRDDCALAANHDWALHQLGVLQQERNDRLLVSVASGIQTKLLEALVLADQVGDRTLEQVDDFLEPLASRMILEIFDSVELDTARAKYLERAFRVTSAGIVKKGYSFHWHLFLANVKVVTATLS